VTQARASNPALIALDWGTTSLRAYLLDRTGNTLERKSAPMGILKVPDSDFDAVFEHTCASWFDHSSRALPILASGMIGSRQGWLEAPYVPCPAGVEQLAQRFVSLTTAKGRRIAFGPGISTENSAGVPDVIRGEETQIVGALKFESDIQLFVLPGTHSKWALAEEQRITRFATFMTGEVFATLSEHSILGRTMKGNSDDIDAFKQGYDYAHDETVNAAGLLQQLFSARTLALFNRIPAEALHAYLSGLLIGSELRGALAWFDAHVDITIIAEPVLASRYQRAFGYSQIPVKIADGNVTPKGLFRLAQASGLLK
jgi:2-dehydro-3-deoxygalactonokinase